MDNKHSLIQIQPYIGIRPFMHTHRSLCIAHVCQASCSWKQTSAPYLHAQAERVEHDEQEHQVLKVAGCDHVPDAVLAGVLGDVTAQWAGL